MSDSVASQFEAKLKISKNQTEISWTSPIIEFVLERKRIMNDGSGQWKKIGCVPSDQSEFSMESSSEISKFQHRVVARMDGVSLESEPADELSSVEMVESGEETSERTIRSPTEALLLDLFRLRDLFRFAATLPTTIPSAPSVPSITQRISDTKVVLSWTPPINDGCYPITSYIVERSNKQRTVWTPIDRIPGSETWASVDWKIPHSAFRIIAENVRGRSHPSEHLVFRQFMPAPPKVELDASNPKYIELKWAVPSSESLQYAETVCFHIWKRVGSETKSKFVKVAKDVKVNSYCDTDVMPGQGYQYQVCSVSSSGKMKDTLTEWIKLEPVQEATVIKDRKVSHPLMAPKMKTSSESNQVKNEPLMAPPEKSSPEGKQAKEPLEATVPSAPNGPPVIQRISEQSIRISWKPPFNIGNSPITSYIIECTTSTNQSWSSLKCLSGNTMTASINLTTDQYQAFRIIAKNIVGCSEPSQSAAIRQLPPAPPRVTVHSHANCLEIVWSVPERPFPDYADAVSFRICKRILEIDGGQSKFVKVAKDLTAKSYRDTDVIPGHGYQYQVCSVSASGKTKDALTEWMKFKPMQELPKECTSKNHQNPKVKSPPVVLPNTKALLDSKKPKVVPLGVTVPSPPNGPLTIQRATEQSVYISWKPPSKTGKSPITSYIVECATTRANKSWTPIKQVSSTRTLALVDLMGSYQSFRIVAENVAGRSEPSPTLGVRALRPAPPRVEVVMQSNCIKVVWSIPKNAFPDYAEAVSFRIRKFVPFGDEEDDEKAKLVDVVWDLKGYFYNDLHVVPGQKYQYEVTAYSATRQMERSKSGWVKFEPMLEKSTSKCQGNISAKTPVNSKK